MYPAISALALIAGAAAAGLFTTTTQAEPPAHAIAEIIRCDDGKVTGSAQLLEKPSEEGVKQVYVMLEVWGLSPGKHAVHIHETGNCTPCGDAGGHFDPGPHGFPSPDGNHPFHSGDLVNIEINAGGSGSLHTSTTRVTLSPGPLSLFDADGSALVIHTDADTYCPEGEVKGCAGGARAACGIIKHK
ncbi:MAG: superoxide dismutase family protein [Gammaproteobacteria bacterium]|jgi:Cu-Zn family superoxide dismutase